MNSIKKEKPSSRSTSLTKPLKKSVTTKDASLTNLNKTTGTKIKKKIVKTSSNGNTKTLTKSKSKENLGKTKKSVKSKTIDVEGGSSHSLNKNINNEVKIGKNVDSIGRLINNSNEILAQQNSLLEKCEMMTKKITASDFEIERLMNKNENDDFPVFLEKYGGKLNQVLGKLKTHTEEAEEIKCK